MNETLRKKANELVLVKFLPGMSKIIDEANHAYCYKYSKQKKEWETIEISGVLFVTEMKNSEHYELFILNRLSLTNFSINTGNITRYCQRGDFMIFILAEAEEPAYGIWIYDKHDMIRIDKLISMKTTSKKMNNMSPDKSPSKPEVFNMQNVQIDNIEDLKIELEQSKNKIRKTKLTKQTNAKTDVTVAKVEPSLGRRISLTSIFDVNKKTHPIEIGENLNEKGPPEKFEFKPNEGSSEWKPGEKLNENKYPVNEDQGSECRHAESNIETKFNDRKLNERLKSKSYEKPIESSPEANINYRSATKELKLKLPAKPDEFISLESKLNERKIPKELKSGSLGTSDVYSIETKIDKNKHLVYKKDKPIEEPIYSSPEVKSNENLPPTNYIQASCEEAKEEDLLKDNNACSSLILNSLSAKAPIPLNDILFVRLKSITPTFQEFTRTICEILKDEVVLTSMYINYNVVGPSSNVSDYM